ncbi:MAG TPA: hypothetical protein VNY74_14475 [Edaphobacter sp.]|nr:hypothetical protein [Edaphobacter sp.]
MKKAKELDPLAPRPSLDFRTGVRGKHFKRMQQGTNIVLIAPDLLDTFPDSEAVNEALRSLKKNRHTLHKASSTPAKDRLSNSIVLWAGGRQGRVALDRSAPPQTPIQHDPLNSSKPQVQT